MSIQIEKGIPIGKHGNERGGVLSTLRAMEIGDSFLLPKDKRNGLFATANRVKGRKFVTRTVDESSVRVWRVQ